MSKKQEQHNQQQEATKTYFLPEYGVSVEAVDLKQVISLAKNQQKGSSADEN